MLPMTVTKKSILAATVAVGLTSAGFYWHRKHELREADQLRQGNLRLYQMIEARVHASDSAALREKAKAPVVREPSSPTPSVEKVDNAAPPRTEPDYRNAGNATPQAALQTIAWACDQGDVAAVMRLIQFDDAARTRALAFMSELPKEARERWPTPEAMGATLLVDAGIRNPFPHATVLDTVSTEKISGERVKLSLPGTRRADSEYQLTSEGWKYAITSESVDAYIAQSRRR